MRAWLRDTWWWLWHGHRITRVERPPPSIDHANRRLHCACGGEVDLYSNIFTGMKYITRSTCAYADHLIGIGYIRGLEPTAPAPKEGPYR